MRVAYSAELPERDVHSLNHQQLSQMIDNDVNETSASSIISDTVRDQILGRPSNRRRRTKVKPVSANPPSPNTLNYKESFTNLHEGTPRQINTSSLEVLPRQQDTSSFEIIPRHNTSSFEIISYPSKDLAKNGSKTSNKSESFVSAENHKIPSKASIKKEESTRNIKNSLNKKEKTAGCLCENCTYTSDHSMKKTDSKQFTKVQTQTIGIQTSVIESDSKPDFKYIWTTKPCDCKTPCNCPECRCGLIDKEVNVPEKPSRSTVTTRTESSSQTLDTEDQCDFDCRCRSPWIDRFDVESTTDSDESYNTDFFDLPYQNNEEYLKLLHELEKKLIARNRERVRKTMLEFEKRSRQNQNLDKPIFDYNDDNACLLRQLGSPSPRGRHVCCKCGKTKKKKSVNSDIMQNEKRWDEMNLVKSVIQSSDPNKSQKQKSARMERSVHKSHWQLDPRTGEWIKLSCYQQTDYARHPPPPQGDYLQDDRKTHIPPTTVRKNECKCRQKRRR